MLKMYSQKELELAIEFGKRGHSLKEFKKFINSKKEKETKNFITLFINYPPINLIKYLCN